MSGFEMKGVCLKPEINLQITRSTPTYGDCFNPAIPTDRLSTINWVVEGTISVYAASMELINDYGVGERMLVPNPDHLRFGKCLLVCTSANAEYYCLSNSVPDRYYNGEVIQLEANEERTFTENNGHLIFCSLGSLTNLDKYGLATIDSDSYVVTAGAEGAIITVFHDSTDD